uniref:Putative peptide transport permease protein Mb1314c n=1 Tax=Anthurium amnicola TaxID=1678845 RepID=A0A1D1ZGH4_9ARAE
MMADETKEPSSSTHFPGADVQVLTPGVVPLHNHGQNDHGPGIYAVPVLPFMGPVPGFSSNNLIPITYNIPTRPDPSGVVSGDNSQGPRQQHGPERQVVVRRFQFAIQIDLGLILKLAAVVFLFNQEGSRQRLITLLLSAFLIYLYQTGAFTPILRWLRRAGAPPQQQAAVRQENVPPVVQEHPNEHQPEENAGAEYQNQPVENEGPVENENHAEVGRRNGVDWLGIAKEIKMVIVGFIISLFPGFHHHHD